MKEFLIHNNYKLIFIQETKLDRYSDDTQITANTMFNGFYAKRIRDGGGGVATFVHKDIQSTLVSSDIGGGSFELVAVSINVRDKNILLINVYITPAKSVPEFKPRIIKLMEKIVQVSQGHENLLIVGDFNLPRYNWESDGHPESVEGQLFQSIDEHLAELAVTQVQKLKNVRNRILDLVFVNDLRLVSNIGTTIENFKGADREHLPLVYDLKLDGVDHTEDKVVNSSKLDLVTYNTLFMHNLQNFQADSDGTVNAETIEHTTSLLVRAALGCTSNRISTTPKWASKHPWLFKDTVYFKLRKEVRRLYRLQPPRVDPTGVIATQYFAAKARMLQRYNELKVSGLRELEKTINPDMNFYNYIKRSKGQNTIPAVMTFNGASITGSDRAAALGKVFEENFVMGNPPVNTAAVQGLAHLEQNQLREVDLIFTNEEIIKAIAQLSLKKDPGPHLIPASIFINNHELVAEWLQLIFNEINANKIFPTNWKESYIIPIPKKGDTKDPKNYRGVAIQPILPKLYDKLLTKKLYAAFKPIIDAGQHGFNNIRNIQSNHLEVADFVTSAMAEGFAVDAVFFDFSKAFDKIDYMILIRKMFLYGFSSDTISTVIAFVTNRIYTVKIDGGTTDIHIRPSSGVPQGSHIGPLLYLIYCNDIRHYIQSECPNVKVLQYADDTKILAKITTEQSMEELQRAINRMASWAVVNKIPLNNTKTQAITFHGGRNPANRHYVINGVPIEQEQTVRDLGVTFDRKFNFVSHHNENMKRARMMIGMAKRFSSNIHNPRFIVNIFRTYILPKIEFGHALWSTTRSRVTTIDSMQSGVLSFALRRTPQLVDLEPHLRRGHFNINSVNARLQSQQFVLIFKILTGTLVTSLLHWIISRQGQHQLGIPRLHRHIAIDDLRNSNPLRNLCENYNQLFHHIRFNPISIPTLKRILREHLH